MAGQRPTPIPGNSPPVHAGRHRPASPRRIAKVRMGCPEPANIESYCCPLTLSNRRPLDPSPRPTVLRNAIQAQVEPSIQRATW